MATVSQNGARYDAFRWWITGQHVWILSISPYELAEVQSPVTDYYYANLEDRYLNEKFHISEVDAGCDAAVLIFWWVYVCIMCRVGRSTLYIPYLPRFLQNLVDFSNFFQRDKINNSQIVTHSVSQKNMLLKKYFLFSHFIYNKWKYLSTVCIINVTKSIINIMFLLSYCWQRSDMVWDTAYIKIT